MPHTLAIADNQYNVMSHIPNADFKICNPLRLPLLFIYAYKIIAHHKIKTSTLIEKCPIHISSPLSCPRAVSLPMVLSVLVSYNVGGEQYHTYPSLHCLWRGWGQSSSGVTLKAISFLLISIILQVLDIFMSPMITEDLCYLLVAAR